MSNITDPFASSLQSAVESLRLAINDPADQIRLLSGLAAFTSPTQDKTSDPTAALCRRAALASLAKATIDWQPSSVTETLAVLVAIRPLFDNEIQYAADVGDTSSYMQLRKLRAGVVADLQARGSELPELLTVTRGTSLPSLVLAYQLYADAARESDLVARNSGVIHPAFMPASFEALSS